MRGLIAIVGFCGLVMLGGCGDGEGPIGSEPPTTLATIKETPPPPNGVGVNRAAHICTYGSAGERRELEGYCKNFGHHPGRLIGVAGSNGQPVVCDDGKPLLVRGTSNEGGVPRCGPTGGGRNGHAIWVPLEAGRGTNNAPMKYVVQQTR